MLVLGMMSGTSTDGIDAALVDLSAPQADDGAPPRWQLLHHQNFPFPTALRAEILACARPDTGTVDRVCALNFDLGVVYADAALATLRAAGLDPAQVDLIGNHGQTVWHIPQHSTLQLGSPAVIAERTGITVVSNLRARDIAAGGHGAPLVAYVDALLFTDPTCDRALQNIGGIANVTFLPASSFSSSSIPTSEGTGPAGSSVSLSSLIPHPSSFAFDTGPGNVLIDELVRRVTDDALTYDRDGALAAQGHPDALLLADLMAHPFLQQQPPKSTGREVFGAPFAAQLWDTATARGLAPADVVATVTLFTARSIADAYVRFLPRVPAEAIISGGGASNPTLLAMLQAELGPATRVRRIDELGIPTEAKEALAFAVLAYETWRGRPSNLPAATGARRPVILGDLTPGARWPPPA